MSWGWSLSGNRNQHIVRGTDAWLCIDPNSAILRFGECLCDEETHASVADTPGGYIVHAVQRNKYTRQILCRDASTCITDLNENVLFAIF